MRKRTIAEAIVAAIFLALLPAAPAVADPGLSSNASGCVAVNDPKWAGMRAMADQRVRDGSLTQTLAEAYKCDPRLAVEEIGNAPLQVVSVTNMPLSDATTDASIQGCSSGSTVTAELSNGHLSFRIGLNWCWDGNVVSNWGGECTGWVSTWAWLNYWYFAGCTTNDFIPYWLDGRYPGGIHHRAIGLFDNEVPWTHSIEQLISIWGHYDGTRDHEVY